MPQALFPLGEGRLIGSLHPCTDSQPPQHASLTRGLSSLKQPQRPARARASASSGTGTGPTLASASHEGRHSAGSAKEHHRVQAPSDAASPPFPPRIRIRLPDIRLAGGPSRRSGSAAAAQHPRPEPPQAAFDVASTPADGVSSVASSEASRHVDIGHVPGHSNGVANGVALPYPMASAVNGAANGHVLNGNGNGQSLEDKVDELRAMFGKRDGEPLKVVGVGAGAWGSVFVALLKETYSGCKDKIDVKIWRRANKALDKEFAEHLFQVINSREDIIRRLIRKCAYLKYVEARLGERVLYADEILRDGFCVNIVDTPLCPLQVVTNLQEAVWDADVIINALPSTETRGVFREIGKVWKERSRSPAVVVSLAKGVEAGKEPEPHIITPTLMIHQETGLPMENVLYLGGPNIAAEIYQKEYANARLCGAAKWRKPLASFFRQRNFIVWDNEDLVTHEVMGGLKNVYAIGAGIVAGATQDSATSKSVYFAHATSEMVFITHLLSPNPEKLAGPLLADTYVTLLKGRNAWYGEQLATGAITAEMGDYAKGKGLIQGVSAVEAFHQVLSQPMFEVPHPVTSEMVTPIELCPILQALYRILQVRDCPPSSILDRLRDEHMYDPAERIAVAPERCYRSKLLERHPSMKK